MIEICKGLRDRVRLDITDPALFRPLAFQFPVLDCIPVKMGQLQEPFRTNMDLLAHFELPVNTLR